MVHPVRWFGLRIEHFRPVFEPPALMASFEIEYGEPVILYDHFPASIVKFADGIAMEFTFHISLVLTVKASSSFWNLERI
jgi:hypothetical protein